MQPLKLLVVEDNIPSLELMTEVFVSLKAEVRPISDSEKAVAMVNQEKFDGVFLDLEIGEQAEVYTGSDPDRGYLHSGLSISPRDQLEPQPRWNAGGSGWLES
jgi:hypothetical protein